MLDKQYWIIEAPADIPSFSEVIEALSSPDIRLVITGGYRPVDILVHEGKGQSVQIFVPGPAQEFRDAETS